MALIVLVGGYIVLSLGVLCLCAAALYWTIRLAIRHERERSERIAVAKPSVPPPSARVNKDDPGRYMPPGYPR